MASGALVSPRRPEMSAPRRRRGWMTRAMGRERRERSPLRTEKNGWGASRPASSRMGGPGEEEEGWGAKRARQQPHGGAGVATVQHAVRLPKGVAAAPADDQRRLVLPTPVDAQGAHAAQGGHTI